MSTNKHGFDVQPTHEPGYLHNIPPKERGRYPGTFNPMRDILYIMRKMHLVQEDLDEIARWQYTITSEHLTSEERKNRREKSEYRYRHATALMTKIRGRLYWMMDHLKKDGRWEKRRWEKK